MSSKLQFFISGVMVLFAGLGANVALASHLSNPACGNVVLDPTSLGGTETFDGCLLTGASNPKVGVVLLHGRGATPDADVVNELRISLNTAGYTTLSIENPAADPATDNTDFATYVADAQSMSPYAFPEAYARVKTAINHLGGLTGMQQIVVIGFSMGSRFGTAAVARISSPSLPIIGLVGVGMYNTSNVDPLDHDFTLDEVTVPVLDIYGDADTNAVTDKAGRVNAYVAGSGTSYTQVVLDCNAGLNTNECHKLVGLKGNDAMPLEVAVNGWMACNAPLAAANCGSAPPITSDGTVMVSSGGGGGGGGGGSMSMVPLGLLALFALVGVRRRFFQ